jgi:nucleoid-associated protein YgaU
LVRKNQGLLQRVRNSEQLISMIMGILVVLAIGGLAYRYFQSKGLPSLPGQKQEQEQQEQEQQEGEEQEAGLPTTHTVKEGENLWKIAEQYYLSGYNWVDIAQANNLANPNQLAIGQQLTIPNVESKTITVTTLPETGAERFEITGDSYTVEEGDSLSKIALRAYGDMFTWPKIWGANRDQISDPNIIQPGMKLEIPRD